MFWVFVFFVVWPVIIAVLIRATKASSKSFGFPSPERLEKWLSFLPFFYGALTGFLSAPLMRPLLLRLTLEDEPLVPAMPPPALADFITPLVWYLLAWVFWGLIGAFFGIGAGGVSGQAYKVFREHAGEGIRELMDWWRT